MENMIQLAYGASLGTKEKDGPIILRRICTWCKKEYEIILPLNPAKMEDNHITAVSDALLLLKDEHIYQPINFCTEECRQNHKEQIATTSANTAIDDIIKKAIGK